MAFMFLDDAAAGQRRVHKMAEDRVLVTQVKVLILTARRAAWPINNRPIAYHKYARIE